MIDRILDILHAADELSGWQVRELRRKSNQLFLNRQAVESRRVMESLTYEVEVLVDHVRKEGGRSERFTGQSRFTLDSSALSRFEQDLKQAVFAAGLVENEAFRMPDPGPFYPTPSLADPALRRDPEGELDRLAGRLRDETGKCRDTRLSAAEFFGDSLSLRHFNSQGIQSAQDSTLLSTEFVVLNKGASGDAECFRACKTRRAFDFAVEPEVRRAAELAEMSTRAQAPATGAADIVFSDSCLDHLFDWFTTQASASAKYNRIVSAQPDQVLSAARPGATPLTLWHNAILPWAPGSYCFDAAGVAGRRLLLVENGVLRNYWSGPRFAQYLKMPASGELGSVEVKAGQTAELDLLKPSQARPLIQVFEFSYFEPNPVTGEFSGEIRSAVEITPAGTKPVKGGSVSGNSARALETAVFSKETCGRERYLGPQAIRCDGLTVAGS